MRLKDKDKIESLNIFLYLIQLKASDIRKTLIAAASTTYIFVFYPMATILFTYMVHINNI
jgi:hypothetical protein